MDDKQQLPLIPVRRAVIIAAVVTVFVVAIYVWWFFGNPISRESGEWGEFGDYIGGVLSALLGLVTLVIVAQAFYLQHQQLQEQKAQGKESASTLYRQQFDFTFFQLAHRVSQILADISVETKNDPPKPLYVSGQDALRILCGELRGKYKIAVEKQSSTDAARTAFSEFYETRHYLLGHYFRSLYHLFKLVHTSKLSDAEKIAYANVARAQVSSRELVLLFYNGLVGEGLEGFRTLIQDYGLLKHVRQNDLFDPAHYKRAEFYEVTAYLSADERAAAAPIKGA